MQQNRRGNAIDDALPFPTADIRRDQQILRGTGRHPFIPGDDRNRQRRLKELDKRLDDFGRGSDLAIQSKRHTDEDLPNLVFSDQLLNMPNIRSRIPPEKRFQRLGRPPEFIT